MLRKLYEDVHSFFSQAAITSEFILSLRQISVLYNAGIPFARSLRIIAQQTVQPSLRKAFAASQRGIETGKTIAASFLSFPEIFPELYVRLIEVGENTGRLEYILDSIANHAEKNQKSAMKLRAALVYPAFVMALCLFFLIIGPSFLLKGLYDFLAGLNIDLPLPTVILLQASKFMRTPIFPIALIMFTIAAVVIFRWFWRQERWRHLMQNLVLAIPVIGPFYQSSQVTMFARSLAIVYESGMPLVEGMALVQKSIGMLRFRYELDNVLDRVMEGCTLQDALSVSGYFPPVLIQFIKAGEEAGDLGRMLNWSAWICEENNDQILNMVMDAIQPLVLLIIGVIVGFMIIATMAPMIKVIQEVT